MFREGKSRTDRIAATRRLIILVASILAVASFIAEYGFYLSEAEEHYIFIINLFIVSLFLLDTSLSFLFAARLKKAFIRALPLIIIAFVFGVQLLIVKLAVAERPSTVQALLKYFRVGSLTRFYFIILQGYIVFTLIFYTQRVSRRLAYTRFRPTQLLLVSFVLMIFAGAFLLLMPKSTPPGQSISFINALFTSTSAVCVTGLIVVDTASAFTRTGQLVIMVLMQIGGLGIMTFAAFFAMLAGRGFSIRERLVFGEVMHIELVKDVSRLVLSILSITFIIEAVGSVFFFYLLPGGGMSSLARVFTSVFHAISGFCNAGFSVYGDGFLRFPSAVGLNVVMMLLIIIGGLGFTVHHDLLTSLWAKLKGKRRAMKLRLQTKVVVLTSITLILIGGVAVYLFEGGHVSLLQSIFQSVTARTAGFNTVSEQSLHSGSQLLTMFLMFIGAAPGSTGGGIKVTTLIVFLATVMGMLRGRSRTELAHKTIPNDTVREAVVIFGLSLFAVMFSFMILLVVESAPFKVLLFETLSAFGTVGLSLGATAHLSVLGKVVITVTMLFGRIGPMTIALAVSGKPLEKGYTYPYERIMVG